MSASAGENSIARLDKARHAPGDTPTARLRLEIREDRQLNRVDCQQQVGDSHQHHLAAEKGPGFVDALGREPVVPIGNFHAEIFTLFRPARHEFENADQH